jgi:hypothetical protein
MQVRKAQGRHAEGDVEIRVDKRLLVAGYFLCPKLPQLRIAFVCYVVKGDEAMREGIIRGLIVSSHILADSNQVGR